MKKTIFSNTWWLWLLVGMILAFLLNNFTFQKIYNFGSCTYNQHSCQYSSGGNCYGGGSSSGDTLFSEECTPAIIRECCNEPTTRECEGTVSDVSECARLTCSTGEYCVGHRGILMSDISCECSSTPADSCTGVVSDPRQCYDKTCNTGYCNPITNTAGGYRCECGEVALR